MQSDGKARYFELLKDSRRLCNNIELIARPQEPENQIKMMLDVFGESSTGCIRYTCHNFTLQFLFNDYKIS